MRNVNANIFLDHTTYEEVAVIYNEKKYFFHGLTQDINGCYSFNIEIWDKNNCIEETIFNKTFTSKDHCLEAFQKEKLFDGKTFWDAEKDMEWIEW